MTKHEKRIIDNRAKISENSNEFPLSLVKCLKTKFLRQNSKGLKNYTFDQQS